MIDMIFKTHVLGLYVPLSPKVNTWILKALHLDMEFTMIWEVKRVRSFIMDLMNKKPKRLFVMFCYYMLQAQLVQIESEMTTT